MNIKFTSLLILTRELRYPVKRGGNRKRRSRNRGLRYLFTLVLGFQENLMQILSAFLLFFGEKKQNSVRNPCFLSSLSYLILLICLVMAQNHGKDTP